MEIGDLQQLGLALFHPRERLAALALGTVAVATTAVRDHRVEVAEDVGDFHSGALHGCPGLRRGRTRRSRNAPHSRRAPRFDRSRWRSSLQLCVAYVAAVGVTPSGA